MTSELYVGIIEDSVKPPHEWKDALSVGPTGNEADRMNDRILSMMRWSIGLIALFGTTVTVLLAVAQFTA